MNDSSGAQWRDGGRRAQRRVKGSNGEESTYAGQDEDKHIVWVWAGKFSGGRMRVSITAQWWKFYCRQNGSFNPVCTRPTCQGKPGALWDQSWSQRLAKLQETHLSLGYTSTGLSRRAGEGEKQGGGGDAWSRFLFSSRELIKEAVHLPLKLHPLATQPCFDVGCGNIC